ncbi:MAG TPA: adenylate/guanylate cyclase domain-containing protein [Vicinamibacterales bacterium]|nr:adenylate/guanylate cyclase domain-containing protein [Vicinamibacterales bacterium]
MPFRDLLESETDTYFAHKYEIVEGKAVPDVPDLEYGPKGRELDLAMLFIDIRESTTIVDGFRRTTAARMYKAFLNGVALIARKNNGELRSFNGDGVLMAFIGDSKRTNAAKAALQMSWFCTTVLRPKLQTYFEKNNQLSDLVFDWGIGIDVGKVLVVRGGIRGANNNDLVWVGNPTNYAVKLSGLGKGTAYHIYISDDVYKNMDKGSRIGGEPPRDMWEQRQWTDMENMTIYRSNWTWTPSGD